MKQCNVEGCNYPVFAKGYCKNHQYLRTDKKQKPIKSRSEKAFRHNYFGFDNQMTMFLDIWERSIQPNGYRYCWISGTRLDNVFNLSYFAHILNKKNYTYWKLNPDNIVLLHPHIHSMVDEFKEEYFDKHPDINFDKWFSLVEEKMEEYEIWKKINLMS